MSAYSGVGYWIIAAGSASTGQHGGPTGGDSSTNWTSIRFASVGSGTTENGTTMSGSGQWNRGLQGGHGQLSNAYNYLAIGWQNAGSSSYGQAHSGGWIVANREAVAATATSSRQTYHPIEGTDGLTDSTWTFGCPTWNNTGYGSMIVFFFSSYTAGDLDNWTLWDGSTTP